jgi:hypothetical protein
VIEVLICIGVVLMVRNYPGGFKVKSEANGILLVTWSYWLVRGTFEYVVPLIAKEGLIEIHQGRVLETPVNLRFLLHWAKLFMMDRILIHQFS